LAQLERAAFGGRRDRFEEGHGTLAVDDALGVELGHAGDAGIAGGLRGVEVDYFLRGFLEGEDDRVGWEGGEVGVQFLRLDCESTYCGSGVRCELLHRGSGARRLWLQCW
jgi:hypothetical protein